MSRFFRRRLPRTSLSFLPLSKFVLQLVIILYLAGYVFWLGMAAKDGLGALLTDFSGATWEEFATPKGLAVTAFILCFAGVCKVMAFSVGRMFRGWFVSLKRRGESVCEVDFGPGLKARPRLEP